jgi:glycosyltransferase involved in cell wall biosynthesis
VDGLIVPNGDVESLAERTMEILGDERLRRSMGDAAVEAARGYLVGAQADRFLESLKG